MVLTMELCLSSEFIAWDVVTTFASCECYVGSSSRISMLTGTCHDRIAHVSQLCRRQTVNVKGLCVGGEMDSAISALKGRSKDGRGRKRPPGEVAIYGLSILLRPF